jgi:thiol-disulfide isomerase/thioredoxin
MYENKFIKYFKYWESLTIDVSLLMKIPHHMKQIALFLIIACLVGCFGAPPQKTGKEGKPMPEFNLLLTDSITWINTRNIPTGKPTALLYYSPYCPYCKALTQEIIEEMDELKNIQFYFISSFPMSIIKAYSEAYQLAKYPNIITGMDTSHLMQDYFEAQGIPYLAIYDKDKKLNQAFLGKISGNQIKKVAEE